MVPDFWRFSKNLVLKRQAAYSFQRNFRLLFHTNPAEMHYKVPAPFAWEVIEIIGKTLKE